MVLRCSATSVSHRDRAALQQSLDVDHKIDCFEAFVRELGGRKLGEAGGTDQHDADAAEVE